MSRRPIGNLRLAPGLHLPVGNLESLHEHCPIEPQVRVDVDDRVERLQNEIADQGVGNELAEEDLRIGKDEFATFDGLQLRDDFEIGLDDDELAKSLDVDPIPVEPHFNPFDFAELPKNEGFEVILVEAHAAFADPAAAEPDLPFSNREVVVESAVGNIRLERIDPKAAQDKVGKADPQLPNFALGAALGFAEERQGIRFEGPGFDGHSLQIA